MTEFAVAGDGVRLAFERAAPQQLRHPEPVMLVHGFGSSGMQNWKSTGWFRTLTEAGFGLVAIDCRGHGESDKPHDEAAYGHDRMAQDVLAVMDACGIARADLAGYSMGGFISMRVLAQAGARVRRLALAGVGEHYLSGPRISGESSRALLSAALLVEDKSTITDPRGILFRNFADQSGKDRVALAACMRAMSPPLAPESLSQLQHPVLVVCGELDDISGPPAPLAEVFLRGNSVVIPGRDHMSAVGDPRTRQAVADFLAA